MGYFYCIKLVVFVVSEVCCLYLQGKPEGERKREKTEIKARKTRKKQTNRKSIHATRGKKEKKTKCSFSLNTVWISPKAIKEVFPPLWISKKLFKNSAASS